MTQREESGEAGSKPKEARALRVELTLTSLIMIVLVIAGVWTLLRLMPVVLVLVTALFIVGTLSPAVDWLEAKRIRRTAGIALVFGALLVVILLLSAFTLPAPGTYGYTFRVSQDGGVSWTYCDGNGAGTGANDFEITRVPTMISN